MVFQEYLSSYLSIDKAATAKAVKSLALGTRAQRQNPSDKRANQIYITEYALRQKDEIMKRLREWTEILTQSIDKAEIDTMHTVLEKMVNRGRLGSAQARGGRMNELNNPLGIEKTSTLLRKFSIPAIIGMVVSALYNVVDRIFISNAPDIGELGLTALPSAFPS